MNSKAAQVSVIALLLAVSGCNDAKSTIDAAALLEERCGVCHSIDIPKNARKSKRDWNECVTRMIARGAKLSPAEKKALVSYLARTYKQ